MKAFFLSRLLREKLLLLSLIAIAAVMWLSSVSTRVRRFWIESSITSSELTTQKSWLGRRAQITADAKTAVERLDPARTFDGARLQAELYSIARGVGIRNMAIDDSASTPGPQFSINTVRFVMRDVSWDSLQAFYAELSKRAPYMGIEEFSVFGNRANPAQLTASLRVSSVEISR